MCAVRIYLSRLPIAEVHESWTHVYLHLIFITLLSSGLALVYLFATSCYPLALVRIYYVNDSYTCPAFDITHCTPGWDASSMVIGA